MNRTKRIALGLSSTLVLGATGAGIAGAAKSGSQAAGAGGGPPGAAAIATYLGLSSADLEMLKRRAAEEGLPYQSLIASVLHKYVSGNTPSGNKP